MASTATPSPTIGKRYVIQGLLGSGGMGAVYRAHDRLTGQDVALKHVSMPTELLMFNSRAGNTDLTVALAQEFKILASLGHPNVINVLDYGFDERRQPFFTMRLLEGADTLLAAGNGQPVAVQVDYLLQRMESYRGLAILTTNMKKALDACRHQFMFMIAATTATAAARKSGRAISAALMAAILLEGELPVKTTGYRLRPFPHLPGPAVHGRPCRDASPSPHPRELAPDSRD